MNYELWWARSCEEEKYPTHDEQGPVIEGRLTRKRLPRTNDYQQAADRYLTLIHI